ncbi:MAG: heme-binding domain-containing protein [Gemmatimonadota bacterium]|nr:heme-binding domain-containing protein [Gemmatimonadota bacterium]MDE3013869.1 heme-binding domain-containing protein [Gemmatimonadota bacterium]
MTKPTRRAVLDAGSGLFALIVVIQLVPVVGTGNPPVSREIAWDSPETMGIAQRACLDCHSNETVWPAYARVAPISWLIAKDVQEGREHLNFSEWDGPNEDVDAVVDMVESGEMPMRRYVLMHRDATLTEREITTFIQGMRETFAADPPAEAAHADDDHADDEHDELTRGG